MLRRTRYPRVVGLPLAIALILPTTNAAGQSARKAGSLTPEQRFVDSVLKRLTLAEKIGQLNQVSGAGEATGPGGMPARADAVRRGDIGSIFNVVGADSTRVLQRIAVEESRSHIPLVFGLDVIHGFRTTFPVPLGEAASFNPTIAERSARVAATESAANGLHWTFTPMVDIARDPRWGRVVEGAGEDVYLGSTLAAARVRGLQGTNLRAPDAVAATAKHFVAYGAAEGGRDYNVADISDRTLREVYLPPFRAAVCAGAATVMASFNEVGGIPVHANRYLISDVLRGEWGFNGMVVSDWTGVGELLNHGIGPDSGTVGKAAIEAGVDMDMVSEIYRSSFPALVRSGRLSLAAIDDAARHVLQFKYRLGLFDNPYRASDANRARTMTLTADDRATARDVARQSIVLLKNQGGVLPLRKDLGAIAVIGSLAADTGAVLGNWAALGRPSDAVSVLDGIKRAVSTGTSVLYARGASPESDDASGIADAVSVARRAQAVVLVIGETPGMSAEAASRASLEVPGAQLQLAEAIQATGVPTVVVLMNGRPLSIPWLADHVPAILETWYLGIEAGTATADVLFGDYNPGGKLPISFPRSVGQVPVYYAHKNTGRPPSQDNKYTSKYLDLPWTPQFPFGYGLSYTTFTVSAPHLDHETMQSGETLRVDVSVANTGRVAGDEVVQLYVRDDAATVTRPVKELRGFRRVTLKPGESTSVRFVLTNQDLAFYDVSMRRVVEPGTFTVYAGSSSDDVREARFTLATPGGRAVPVPDGCARFR
ncbi:MAG: glycoside hydrolase family 3 N-terminal domain-containing protein [Gemmatimonadaceae bacterium]